MLEDSKGPEEALDKALFSTKSTDILFSLIFLHKNIYIVLWVLTQQIHVVTKSLQCRCNITTLQRCCNDVDASL